MIRALTFVGLCACVAAVACAGILVVGLIIAAVLRGLS